MHEPELVEEIARDRRVSPQLSGHTHGLQVKIPLVGGYLHPEKLRKYARGLYKVNETWLYVNRGIGTIGLPVRFNARPEITEITLIRE